MKARVNEYDGCFGVDLQAENMQEAATLVRMGMNRTSDLRYLDTMVTRTTEDAAQQPFELSIVVGKLRRPTSTVPRAKLGG